MKLCLLFHTWSRWERRYDCKFERYCKVDGCNAEEFKYEHVWGEWFYETSGSCKVLRECHRCGEIDIGTYRHGWTDWNYESTNSCCQIRNCSRCGKAEQKKIVHQMSNWKYKNDKQCDVYKTCKRCGYTENDSAHKLGNWEYKSENDCGQIRVCERCGSKEIGWERHEWEKVGFFKWICKRCNKKKTIKYHIIPFKWRSKKMEEINSNSNKMKLEEYRRLRIIQDIIRGEALERQREQERIKNHQSISRSFKKSMMFLRENLFLDCLIIDSNIWMDDRPQYDNFMSVFRFILKSFNIRYIFYGPQFDEICNKKKRTEYGESANRRSRIAIKRIDKLSNENLLEITQINFESKYPGHVDPLLVKLLLMDAKKGKSVALLSNDIELRIRAREKLKEHSVNYYRIFEMDDLEKHIETIQLAMKEGITDPGQHSAENVIYL